MINNELTISLKDFNGPLDLLLHLIRTQELDIFDLPITKVTDQFLHFIDEQLNPSLDSAGEYLYMAATLIKIKSRFLLPTSKTDDDKENEDPRQELVNALVEYQRYQTVIDDMSNLEENRGLSYTRPVGQIPQNIKVAALSAGVTLKDLQNAFLSIVNRQIDLHPRKRKIEQEHFSVADKIQEIKFLFHKTDLPSKLEFDFFFKVSTSSDELITTFLAILELAKDHIIVISQNTENTIFLEKGGYISGN
ncbi:segregation and condensation protein A [Oenococcus sicerae]|uniref:segregation and condensation protein A n=1 Tax=Oenococcus sicerae TaxID=2203724 RepID=UPI0039E93A43